MLSEKNEIIKICTKCKIPKILSEFSKHKKCRFGVNSACKVCEKIRVREWSKENPEKARKQCKRWATNNAKKKQKLARKWYKENSGLTRERSRIWYKENPQKVQESLQRTRKNRLKKNRKKRKTNPKFKLNANISVAICCSLKGNKGGWHWEDIVGYTLKQLKKHLEKQFAAGMIWDNYGRNGWHIDHKIPTSAFNFTKPEHKDFKRCWALSNLQPMWEKENIIKSNKLTKHFQPSLLF